jgi:pimeloyl-ACP methyl ester carboxylesterase
MGESRSQPARADLGHYQLAYRSAGSGQPTVVLEAGGGCTQDAWADVFDAIAQFTGVVSYDRLGLGASDPGSRRRTCLDLIRDLHDLLQKTMTPGPYVLVGHSYGGQVVRLYTHHYPQDVVGMVLVDAVHHEQNARALSLMPPASPDDGPRLTNWREALTHGYTDDASWDPEGLDSGLSDAQVREVGSLGSIPLIVLTARDHGDPPPDLPADLIAAYEQMFQELQRDLVRLSTRGTHVMAERSGHFIQRDEPELVVAAIRQVVEMAQIESREASS